MATEDRLDLEWSEATKVQAKGAWFQCSAVVIVGLVLIVSGASRNRGGEIATGAAALLVGVCVAALGELSRRRVRHVMGYMDADGISVRKVPVRSSRSVRWKELAGVRFHQGPLFASIRFEPTIGKTLTLPLGSTATDASAILDFAERHMPPGNVDRVPTRSLITGSSSPDPNRVELRPKLSLSTPEGKALLFMMASVFVVAVVFLLIGFEPLVIVSASFLALVAVLVVGFIFSRQGMELDRSGIHVRLPVPFGRHSYAWSDLRTVQRATMSTGRPGLRLVGVGQAAGLMLPMHWTTLGELDLIAAMKRLATPHIFDGP